MKTFHIHIGGFTYKHLLTWQFWWILWSAFRGFFTNSLYIIGNGEINPNPVDGYKARTSYIVVASNQESSHAFFTRNGYKAILCGWIFNQMIYHYSLETE